MLYYCTLYLSSVSLIMYNEHMTPLQLLHRCGTPTPMLCDEQVPKGGECTSNCFLSDVLALACAVDMPTSEVCLIAAQKQLHRVLSADMFAELSTAIGTIIRWKQFNNDNHRQSVLLPKKWCRFVEELTSCKRTAKSVSELCGCFLPEYKNAVEASIGKMERSRAGFIE